MTHAARLDAIGRLGRPGRRSEFAESGRSGTRLLLSLASPGDVGYTGASVAWLGNLAGHAPRYGHRTGGGVGWGASGGERTVQGR